MDLNTSDWGLLLFLLVTAVNAVILLAEAVLVGLDLPTLYELAHEQQWLGALFVWAQLVGAWALAVHFFSR